MATESDPRAGQGDGRLDSLSALEASRLLPLGLSQPAGPVADLIDRLTEADGEEWLRHALERGPIGDASCEAVALANGRADVSVLEAVKDRAKRMMSQAATRQEMLSATLAYFLSIAAGLAHHGVLMTSQSRDAVDQALVDLSDAMPDPWSLLLQTAAMATSTRSA